MKTRALPGATIQDLKRLDAAEQRAAELGEDVDSAETSARAAKPGFKPAHKAAKTARKPKAKGTL